MATIEKRVIGGKTKYRVKVRLKGFPEETATFERLTDAKTWASGMETKIREGRHQQNKAAQKYTLHDAIERYVETVLPRKPKLEKDQKQQLSIWDNALGEYTLVNITPALIADVRDRLASEKTVRKTLRTPGTVNRYMAALSHLFTIATKEWGWLNHNPVLHVSKLKEPRGRIRFLSDEERSALLKACQESESKGLYTIVVTCLSTGARKMEIVDLKWADIDFNRSLITLHETKNNERRVLPLKGLAFDLLQEHFKKRNPKVALVFPSHADSEKSIDIRTPWENALIRAKIQDFRFHDLRHSAASYLAMNGASLAEIAEVLGHKTLSMVKRYAHLSEAHTAKVVESMNAKIFGDVAIAKRDGD